MGILNELPMQVYGVVVSMSAFHRSNRGSNPGQGGEFPNDKHHTLVPSVNPTCHPSDVCKWVPVNYWNQIVENTRGRRGALACHLVEAIEKGAFGSPSTSVCKFQEK